MLRYKFLIATVLSMMLKSVTTCSAVKGSDYPWRRINSDEEEHKCLIVKGLSVKLLNSITK